MEKLCEIKQKLLTDQLRFVVGHHLVEDVVASLIRKLECHSRLLQQVYQSGLTVTAWPKCDCMCDIKCYLHVSISALASFPVVPK